MLEEVYDPETTRRLSSIGVTDGWRCLELGAGAGSIARWLAERVGPAGQVVAADIDTRFLQDLDLSNVEVRQLDIRTTDLENERYDLVHCRALLIHLTDTERVGRRMVAALRTGGWLLAEEPDLTARVAVTRDHPDAETFDSFVRRTTEWYNSRFGRSLPLLLDRLGLADCGNEVTSSIVRGGEPRARLYARDPPALPRQIFRRGRHLARGVRTIRARPARSGLRIPGLPISGGVGTALVSSTSPVDCPRNRVRYSSYHLLGFHSLSGLRRSDAVSMPGEAGGPVEMWAHRARWPSRVDQFTYGLRMPKARRGFQPSVRPFAAEVEGRPSGRDCGWPETSWKTTDAARRGIGLGWSARVVARSLAPASRPG